MTETIIFVGLRTGALLRILRAGAFLRRNGREHRNRLMELLDLSDAYIACGMSPGTLAEVSMAWDYMIKKFIEKSLVNKQ